jgi:hypothetical protein
VDVAVLGLLQHFQWRADRFLLCGEGSMSKGGAIRWSDAQLAEFEAKRGRSSIPATAGTKARRGDRLGDEPMPPLQIPTFAPKGGLDALYALGRIAKGKMNGTEKAYAQRLEVLKHDGAIIDWKFHVLRVRLADNTYYEPDFIVMTAERELQIHETKGSFTTDKGQIKVKLCAEVLPWFRVFKCSKQNDGSWVIQEFNK